MGDDDAVFSRTRFCLLCNISLEPPPSEEAEPILIDLDPEPASKVREVANTSTAQSEAKDTQPTQAEEPETQVVKKDPESEAEQVAPVKPNEEDTDGTKAEAANDDKNKVVAMDTEEAPDKIHPLAVLPASDEEKDTLQKYQDFLASVLHINIKTGTLPPAKPTAINVPMTNGNLGSSGFRSAGAIDIHELSIVDTTYDEFPFCINCKDEIRKLYETHTQMTRFTKKFEKARDAIATTMITTFFEQKILDVESSADLPKSVSLKKSKIATVLRKWKTIYSGEAEKQAKIKALAEGIQNRGRKNMTQSTMRPVAVFPEGTGLSIQELRKMQRMMTACYFTPKMSVVRKKDKLFFRVGIPKGDEQMKLYECKICHMNFPLERTLNVHMVSHKLQKRRRKKTSFQCKECGEQYKDRKKFIIHKRTHVTAAKKPRRPAERSTCDQCDKRFPSKSALSVHQAKVHDSPKPHHCEICNESFTTEYHYKKHSAQHTHVDFSIHDIFSCKECSKAFLKAESLNEHLKVHSVSNILECSYCGKPFENAQLLEDHAVGHEEGNPYNCEACTQKFPSEVLMITHLKSHRPKPFPCLYCGKPCRSGDGLRKHELTHLQKGQKPFVCEVCGESFIERKSLHAHSAKHTGKLPYRCTICEDEEGFKDSRDLRKHKIEAHPEQNPIELKFVCEICWYWFATPELLEDHNSKTHQKYKCDVCNKVFKLGDHLRRHSYIHTGEKPFNCEHCQKSFNQESNLKEHMYRHTGIRPHQCPHCPGVGYLRRVQLKEHMQKEHQISNVPTLPMGRASQNARRAGTHPVPTVPTAETITSDLPDVHSNFNPAYASTHAQPIVVNNITLDDESGRLAPIIMRNLQNRSNQSMIVRRGIQPTETPKDIPTIHIKSESVQVQEQYQVTEGIDQQYVIYL